MVFIMLNFRYSGNFIDTCAFMEWECNKKSGIQINENPLKGLLVLVTAEIGASMLNRLLMRENGAFWEMLYSSKLGGLNTELILMKTDG